MLVLDRAPREFASTLSSGPGSFHQNTAGRGVRWHSYAVARIASVSWLTWLGRTHLALASTCSAIATCSEAIFQYFASCWSMVPRIGSEIFRADSSVVNQSFHF